MNGMVNTQVMKLQDNKSESTLPYSHHQISEELLSHILEMHNPSEAPHIPPLNQVCSPKKKKKKKTKINNNYLSEHSDIYISEKQST